LSRSGHYKQKTFVREKRKTREKSAKKNIILVVVFAGRYKAISLPALLAWFACNVAYAGLQLSLLLLSS
jgi:hypothetical protein